MKMNALWRGQIIPIFHWPEGRRGQVKMTNSTRTQISPTESVGQVGQTESVDQVPNQRRLSPELSHESEKKVTQIESQVMSHQPYLIYIYMYDAQFNTK